MHPIEKVGVILIDDFKLQQLQQVADGTQLTSSLT